MASELTNKKAADVLNDVARSYDRMAGMAEEEKRRTKGSKPS